jgi:alpha-glucosidase
MAAEVFTNGGLMAEVEGTLTSPWRLIALGSLQTVTNSTLGTDLAAPAVAFDKQLVKPGHASWSWAILKDDATVYDVQKQFIDYAADMRWDYTLIDADWDRKIGYDKVKELVDYAATKERRHSAVVQLVRSMEQDRVLAQGPTADARTAREAEFKRLREMGVKGVKIDFFAGDGQSMIAYYVGILRDAADAGLLVNFHGATLPRGWTRTWPNLMTMEAVRASSSPPSSRPTRTRCRPTPPCCRSPATCSIRWTSRRWCSAISRRSSAPAAMASSWRPRCCTCPASSTSPKSRPAWPPCPTTSSSSCVTLPRSWDDSRLVDGYPGKYAVIARRSGDTWYIAGINATDADKS